MIMNILEVKDLCKTYGTGETAVHALNHISFSVRKGEFIAIVGESGAGECSGRTGQCDIWKGFD